MLNIRRVSSMMTMMMMIYHYHKNGGILKCNWILRGHIITDLVFLSDSSTSKILGKLQEGGDPALNLHKPIHIQSNSYSIAIIQGSQSPSGGTIFPDPNSSCSTVRGEKDYFLGTKVLHIPTHNKLRALCSSQFNRQPRLLVQSGGVTET